MTKNKTIIEESTTNSSIAYKGSVTTKTVFNGKIVDSSTSHNEGHAPLFKLLANSIAGVYDLDIIPRYICGYSNYGSNSKNFSQSQQTFANAVPYSSKKVQSQSSDGSCKVVISFLIPYSQISTTIETKYYGLYSDPNLTNLLAHVELDSSYKGDGATNKVVTWTMSVGNSSK